MIGRKIYTRQFLFSALLLLLVGSLFIGTNEVLATTGQLSWEARDWDLDYHSTSTISVVDAQGRADVLKFYKWDNYHAQARSQIRGLGNEDSMVVEVDFYADYVYSWSWAPVLKLTWPSAGLLRGLRNKLEVMHNGA